MMKLMKRLMKRQSKTEIDALRSRRPFAPTPVPDSAITEAAEYRTICQQCGVMPAVLKHLELRAFLASAGIPEYDPSQVAEHMRLKARAIGKSWKWYAVRENDSYPSPDFEAFNPSDRLEKGVAFDEGRCAHGPYQHVIPGAILETVARIAVQCEGARFYITDYSVLRPDPFLGVGIGGMPLIVVDFWNEPGFKPSKHISRKDRSRSMKTVKVYGASDDLIEVEGDIREEFNHYSGSDEPCYLAFDDGTVLKVVYNSEGEGQWKIDTHVKGSASVLVKQATNTEDDYSDVATVAGKFFKCRFWDHYPPTRDDYAEKLKTADVDWDDCTEKQLTEVYEILFGGKDAH